jgi:hypothetical protein
MPSVENLDKREWYCEPISQKQAEHLVELHHYAGGMSNTSIYRYGLFDWLGNLKGCAVWLCPTKNACLTVDPDDWKKVISLSRLAIASDVPRNAGTFLISRSCKEIKRDGRFRSLVSYADSSQGHTGLLYRAAGWMYVGPTAPTPLWIEDSSGRYRSIKTTKTLTVAQMKERGWSFKGNFVKHKFVRFLDRSVHKQFCEL